MMNQKYLLYMYLLKARTFIALLIVIGFFSVSTSPLPGCWRSA